MRKYCTKTLQNFVLLLGCGYSSYFLKFKKNYLDQKFSKKIQSCQDLIMVVRKFAVEGNKKEKITFLRRVKCVRG